MTTKRPDIAAIRARLAAATPGPWRLVEVVTGMFNIVGVLSSWNKTPCVSAADAALISHAPADLAALCGEVEELRKTLGSVRDHLYEIDHHGEGVRESFGLQRTHIMKALGAATHEEGET